jgi:predicted site-specific integrase-resolvase
MSVYRPNEFAKLIGKSTSTLRRWDREGVLSPKRTPGNQRYYTDEDLRYILSSEKTQTPRKTVVYCRVSSSGQRDDLASQVKAMETYCLGAGIAVDEWLNEIGGGLNFKRKVFLKLMKSIRMGEVEHLLIAHKDRLARFAFELIEELASWYECKITVVNQESLSPQQEMVEDLMSIIHTFSCRLYGLRNYKKQIRKIAEFGKLD